MSNKHYNGKIPFVISDEKIWLVLYSGYKFDLEKDNFIFEDTFSYTNYSRGRSSTTFTMESKTYSCKMFVSEFHKMIKQTGITINIKGKWTFTKKGSNFSLVYLGEKK